MADEEFDAPMSDVRLELDVAKLQRYLDSTVPELGSSSNLRIKQFGALRNPPLAPPGGAAADRLSAGRRAGHVQSDLPHVV